MHSQTLFVDCVYFVVVWVMVRVAELLMGVTGCTVPAIQSLFSTTFLKNCGRGEGLGTTTCPITVIGGRQGHAPSEILLPQQSLFLCQFNFMEIMRLIQR